MNTTMNKYFKQVAYLLLPITCYLLPSAMLTSCSDDYMKDMNTDPTKSQVAAPGSELTFAMLSTYGDFNAMETMRSYIAPYTQQYGGSWNSAHYGGANNYYDQNNSALWNAYYTKGIKNLVDAENGCTSDNVLLAAIKIHKVYMLNVLTDVYGDIPCSEAGQAVLKGIETPKYDKQADIYNYFFKELDDAIAKLTDASASTALTNADVTSLKGNVDKWLRYANALKLRLAMRISDVNPTLAETKFKEAADNALKPDECAYIIYLHQPFYFGDGADELDFRTNAFSEIIYGQDKSSPTLFGKTLRDLLRDENDPRLKRFVSCLNFNFRDNTDPTVNCPDFTEEVEANGGLKIEPACMAWYDQKIQSWPGTDFIINSPKYQKLIAGHESYEVLQDYRVMSVRGTLSLDFLLPETPGMLMSGAEVCFLKAEAATKGWISDDANTLYQRGIRAALETVINKVYCSDNVISDADIDTYVNNHTLTAGKEKEQINTQAYFLHFANPCECWANLRRADYPQLYNRKDYGEGGNGFYDSESIWDQPVRLYYPAFENNYNSANYKEAINRPKSEGGHGGKFSWHNKMWWDQSEMNYKKDPDLK